MIFGPVYHTTPCVFLYVTCHISLKNGFNMCRDLHSAFGNATRKAVVRDWVPLMKISAGGGIGDPISQSQSGPM